MTYFYEWLTVLFISLLGSMIPGVSFALVLKNTLHSSRAAGIWTALGLALGMSIYTCIVLFGLSYVILVNPILSKAICWFGAIYLAYVGIQSLFARAKQINLSEAESRYFAATMKSTTALLMGFFTNLFNPKVMLFFLALFTQFIHEDMASAVAWIYGLTVVLVEFCWFSLVAILLTHSALQKRFQAFSHWIERLSGVVLLGISFHLAREMV